MSLLTENYLALFAPIPLINPAGVSFIKLLSNILSVVVI
nr:MAG TPA: hypothetical protein [Caudoviricetes sp.]